MSGSDSSSAPSGRIGWKEGLAAAGVVLSLIFVGVELRLNTQAIQATVRNDLATASRDWTLANATTPELSEAYLAWRAGEEVTPVQERMVTQLLVGLLRNVENVFLQVQTGSVDESALNGYGFHAMPVYSTDNFAVLWGDIRFSFHPEFVEAFEERHGLGPDATP